MPPTPKEMGKEKEGRVEKEKSDKKKEKQKPPPPEEEVEYLLSHDIAVT